MRAQRHLRETHEEQGCEGSAANPGLQWRLKETREDQFYEGSAAPETERDPRGAEL